MKDSSFSYTFTVFSLLFRSLVTGITVIRTGKILSQHEPVSNFAEIHNSSINDLLHSDQGEVTICARFLVYQFVDFSLELNLPFTTMNPSQVFMSLDQDVFLAAISMNQNLEVMKESVPNWVNGKNILFGSLGGQTLFTNATNIQPVKWNKICFAMSVIKEIFQITFNEEIILNFPHFTPPQKSSEKQNLILMGMEKASSPFSTFGAITDVNIWDRLLTGSEVDRWGRCQLLPDGGNVLSWSSAKWDITAGLQEEEVAREEICAAKDSFVLVSEKPRSFDATDKYCRMLGGEMMVARDGEALDQMIQTYNFTKPPLNFGYNMQQFFFIGYRQNENEVYLDVNTGDLLPSMEIQHCMPGSCRVGDCAAYHLQYQLFSLDCDHQFRSLCRVWPDTSFHLQGVCKNSRIDRFYSLQSPGSLLGYTKTRMVWSEENTR